MNKRKAEELLEVDGFDNAEEIDETIKLEYEA